VNIKRHPDFKKHYKQRISHNLKLIQKTSERLQLFQDNPSNSLLKNHALVGKKIGLRAFSVTGDIRIVYLPVSENEVILLDIGSHNQVY